MMKITNKWIVLIGAVALAFATGCSSDDDDGGDSGTDTGGDSGTTECTTELVVGGMFKDIGGDVLHVQALEMAAADINSSGALGDSCIKIQPILFSGTVDRFTEAKALVEGGAIGLVSQYSSSVRAVLRVTNNNVEDGGAANADQIGDGHFTHCSGSSTSTSVNKNTTPASDGLPMGDDNDAVYRGVADDSLQSQVVWTVLQDKTAAGATIAIIYDSNDSYSSDFKDAILALDDGSRNLVAVDQPVTAEMDAAAVTAFTEAYNAISPAPTGMVSIGLATSAGKAMNAISSSFTGTLVVTDGQISDTFFDGLGADFITWLNDDANQVVGTTPYYEPEGTNTTAWVNRLSSVTGGTTAGPDNAFTPMFADCLYQIALAHMVGSAANDDAVEAVYQGMKTFKTASADLSGRTAVVPTSDGLAAAKTAIDGGASVYLDGASGPLLFSEVGDRHYSMQVYATLEIENDGVAYSWVVDKLWRNLEP